MVAVEPWSTDDDEDGSTLGGLILLVPYAVAIPSTECKVFGPLPVYTVLLSTAVL